MPGARGRGGGPETGSCGGGVCRRGWSARLGVQWDRGVRQASW